MVQARSAFCNSISQYNDLSAADIQFQLMGRLRGKLDSRQTAAKWYTEFRNGNDCARNGRPTTVGTTNKIRVECAVLKNRRNTSQRLPSLHSFEQTPWRTHIPK
ncbi:hypothetical protein AVEN_154595-1 [Araneus ventricosus]|uniref:Uncharacterized protein n=1 Tax=Araneus ventricosus TaxID=182803 RepID=A0A4Y2FRU7_ARAVE|nr:hypothetical protein AVEN_154595-1 [Araneus ventricosus]